MSRIANVITKQVTYMIEVWARIIDHMQITPGKRSGLAHLTHSPRLTYNVVKKTNSKMITMITMSTSNVYKLSTAI